MSENEVPQGDLTKLMLFFGRVSEVHLNNLKSFPWIFFNGLTAVNLDYDISTKRDGQSLISYDLTVSEENDSLPKRFEALESAVRSLFWKEILVKVSINGEEKFKSES